VSWGIVSTLTGVVQSYGGLIACRLLLGLMEGGLLPGLTVYLTMFYTKKELALRIGYLFVSSALAGACGGLLAYGIGFMDGVAGQSGWRWVFIIEGKEQPSLTLAKSWFRTLTFPARHSDYALWHCNMASSRRQPEHGMVSHSRRTTTTGRETSSPTWFPRRTTSKGYHSCIQGLEDLAVCRWPVYCELHAVQLLYLPANYHQRSVWAPFPITWEGH
jgi:MFS family permease